MKKTIKKLVGILILVCLILVGNLIWQGYQRYKEAVKDNPIDILVEEVRSQEGFVSYDQIDEDFLQAVVAIEDRRFFTREGVDFIAIGRSLVTNIISGEIREGGSTITQQVGKNFYFSHAPSITRKIAEVFLVEDFESKYTKEEILALYVNIIYYGDGYYGVFDASQGYFGKDPSDLTLYEATLLAGFPQSPSRYQLSNGYELINKRQKNIVSVMLELGLITQEEADEVLSQQPN